jgi:hypothetical protein
MSLISLFIFDIFKVPSFDARQVPSDAPFDFDNLGDSFPRFDEKIPVGSCIATGHSISAYIGKGDGDKSSLNVRLATNQLFIIVLGTPYTRC